MKKQTMKKQGGISVRTSELPGFLLALLLIPSALGWALKSDEFTSSTLNTQVWEFINPLGDGSVGISGANTSSARLNISVPAGTSHDVWNAGNFAPRVMQSVADGDFEVEVRFDSRPISAYQMQGVLFEEGAGNFLRFDFFSNSGGIRLFAASFYAGTPTVRFNSGIPAGASYYIRIKRSGDQWVQSYSNDGATWVRATSFTHALKVGKAGVFAGNAGSPSPAHTASIDYFRDISSASVPDAVPDADAEPVPPPSTGSTGNSLFSLWYGNRQAFGHIGVTQRWANILGRVKEPANLSAFTYSLNGAGPKNLSLGPNDTRLASSGDFNVEIPLQSLKVGSNQVVIKATGKDGNSVSQAVTLDFARGKTWSPRTTVDWGSGPKIHELAQIVDGNWSLEANGTIRSRAMGYDRLVALGDTTWSNYEVTVPVTVYAVDRTGKYPPLVGVIARWAGHYQDGRQPSAKWWPLGILGAFRWGWPDTPHLGRVELLGSASATFGTASSKREWPLGIEHIFKLRTQTKGGLPEYSVKVWRKGMSEPGWEVVRTGYSTDLQKGSVVLVAHHVDASFGKVEVVPIGDQAPPAISGVSVAAGEQSAVISWTTDVSAAGRVEFGLTDAYGSNVGDGNMKTSHRFDLTGLRSGTTYHYRVFSVDAQGNMSHTENRTFATWTGTSSSPSANPVSDGFNGSALDASLWNFLNPRSDASGSVAGGRLTITIPEGVSHDMWTDGAHAPRVVQKIGAGDFDVEVKFVSLPNAAYQMQGIVVDGGETGFLRFDMHHNGSGLKVFAAAISGGKASVKINRALTSGFQPRLLRVKRIGDRWIQSYSTDGSSWTVGADFSQPWPVSGVGIFGGNYDFGDNAPAFKAEADYFLNTASPN